jgi:hypothetical protein
MLHGMGYDTGVSLDGVRAASHTIARALGRALPSRTLRALDARSAAAAR